MWEKVVGYYLNMSSNLKKMIIQGSKDGSVARNTYCTCRGFRVPNIHIVKFTITSNSSSRSLTTVGTPTLENILIYTESKIIFNLKCNT